MNGCARSTERKYSVVMRAPSVDVPSINIHKLIRTQKHLTQIRHRSFRCLVLARPDGDVPLRLLLHELGQHRLFLLLSRASEGQPQGVSRGVVRLLLQGASREGVGRAAQEVAVE